MPHKAGALALQTEPSGAAKRQVTGAARAGLQRAPEHGDLELNFVYSGGLRLFIGGRFVEIGAGTLCVFWAALPHYAALGSAKTQFMHARVPLLDVLRYDLPSPFVRKVLGGEVVIDSQSSSWDAELMRRWVADHEGAERATLRACELEIEARLRRLSARRQQRAAPRSVEHKARGQVEAIAGFLAESYREDISTADIGRAVRLHPNYAMTLFRRECGMSIWQYLIRLRLSRAQLMLLTTDKSVLAIALESGFGSLARFYAAFTRQCEISPGEFRKRGAPWPTPESARRAARR